MTTEQIAGELQASLQTEQLAIVRQGSLNRGMKHIEYLTTEQITDEELDDLDIFLKTAQEQIAGELLASPQTEQLAIVRQGSLKRGMSHIEYLMTEQIPDEEQQEEEGSWTVWSKDEARKGGFLFFKSKLQQEEESCWTVWSKDEARKGGFLFFKNHSSEHS